MALYAFDGTWNLQDRKEQLEAVRATQYGEDRSCWRETVESNVHRFREFHGADSAEYLQGVGTRFAWIGRLFGGAFGIGGKHRIRRMYRALSKRYFDGDRHIDLIGFSRGAALAVHFANVLRRYGVRHPGNTRHFAWWYYPGLGWTFRHPKPGERDAAKPAIRFLGLFDTVGSFGVPIGPLRNRSRRWWLRSIPENVERSYHAMALDEVRRTFSLIRPTPTVEDQHYEVWFRGVHSNIGGGYVDRGLSDIALAWMIEMYVWTLARTGAAASDRFTEALRLLEPEPGAPPDWRGLKLEALDPQCDGELGRPPDAFRQAWRDMPPGALVHHSVFRRSSNLLLDHHRSNRRLLRRIPPDARPVYDPPLFYSPTPRQAAARAAEAAFRQVPVRPKEWLMVASHYVFRSDAWIAVGTSRADCLHVAKRESFVTIAAEWLLHGKPRTPPPSLPATVKDLDDKAVPAAEVAGWLIPVLAALEYYVPALRDFTGSIRETPLRETGVDGRVGTELV